MSDITELKRRLEDNVAQVAAYLLPNGHREGHEWRVGSLDGERGQSLGVHLSGAKAGVWADFNSGDTGDLIDLWMSVRRCKLVGALDEIRAYFGIQSPQGPYRDPRPQYTRPPKPRCVAPIARVLNYLSIKRKIPESVIELYHVGEDGNRIIFPFLLPDGTLALAKAREAVDGAKPVPTAANCEPILFGWQAVSENAREVVLTEGEIDTLAMAAYGHAAMSVPFGGGGKGKQNWIENEFERLERFEKIYLATDMDEPGDQAAAEIASRLGRHRCFRVMLPRKDANQCLMEDIPDTEIAACIANAQSLDPEGLMRAGAFENRVVHLFWPARGEQIGYSLPYSGLSGRLIFRPAEFTLWTGGTGDGKSMILSDCIPHWIRAGSRICLASLEMKPEMTLKRLVKQTGGVDRPAIAYIHQVFEYLDRGLLLYEKVGKQGTAAILEVFDYARAKYGCDQFIIDSLMRLGISAEDYDAQEKAVFQMVQWTVEHNVHLHLVAHARKAGKDRGVPETEDIKGTSEIGGNAFNVVALWRNRKLEPDASQEQRPEFTDDPGVTINVAKQRNGDFEGKVKFFFSLKTNQYFSVSDNRQWPRSYVQSPRDAERELVANV